jgi:hypothetical protein
VALSSSEDSQLSSTAPAIGLDSAWSSMGAIMAIWRRMRRILVVCAAKCLVDRAG